MWCRDRSARQRRVLLNTYTQNTPMEDTASDRIRARARRREAAAAAVAAPASPPLSARSADGGKSEAELVRDMERHLILKRFGSPREAARACLFLLSDAASFVTGSALMCDGGWSAL